MAKSVFISYASADQDTANKLVSEIERRGIPCWISSRNIRPGEDYQRAIVTALETSGVVLLLFSQHANESPEIPKELALASKFRKTIIPARVQDIVPSGSFAYQITTAQFIDLFRGFDDKVQELCAYLAEELQIADEVRARLSSEKKRKESKRKTMRFAIAALIILLVVGLAWMLGPRLKEIMSRGSSSSNEPAMTSKGGQPEPKTTASKTDQAIPPTKAVPAPGEPQPVAPTGAPTAAVAQPQPTPSTGTPPAPPKILASCSYGGVRFDVKRINTNDGRAPVFLIAATNTQQRDLRFMIISSPTPKVIDSNGIASSEYKVSGVALCTIMFAGCSTAKPSFWSIAYPGVPLDFVLTFRAPLEFRGSTAGVSFDVLLGDEKDDGTIKPTLVPVVLPSLPLGPDAPLPQALASRIYEGIRFDVMRVRADEKAITVLVAATNAQPKDLKFMIVSSPDPKVIDDNGMASSGYVVDGVAVCTIMLPGCKAANVSQWSLAYPGVPLTILLTFRGPGGFRGSSANISFDVLLGAEKDDGSIVATLVPVVLPNVPISH